MNDLKILMLSKKENPFCDYAEQILRSNFLPKEFLSVRGKVDDCFDNELYKFRPEYIISFVSPWIISKEMLDLAQNGAINFHPGSPDYPGTGCYNFALYEDCREYGVTVHHMEEQVDSGDIIMTSYFDISKHETIETLKLKSMNHLLYCFEKIVRFIAEGKPLPVSNEKWRRKPFTRKEMLKLFEIDLFKHDKLEIEKRIRAADFPGYPGAYITVVGHKFYFLNEDR